MKLYKDYEMVIGLEVHVELKTKTKIFCACKTDFGAEPNTNICPVCMGMPGALPFLNKTAVKYAIKAGLATGCSIAHFSKFDRKNYFYPDLPKGYQISQYDKPLCENGCISIVCETGHKNIGITRIHLEEDAGKLIHEGDLGTLIDFNRCGVPLIEIVSEPDMRSAPEVDAFLKKLRQIILYTGISDCKMNEGSFRCDVNLSVHKLGEPFGTRTEMKNLNSFQFITKAIEYEYRRQVDAIERGEEILRETRRYYEASGKTYSMRTKEAANDYRFFPEPDLMPFTVTEDEISIFASEIPMLPDERKALYMEQYGLTAYDSDILTNDKTIADYFEESAVLTRYPKLLANLLITEVLGAFQSSLSTQDVLPIAVKSIASVSEHWGDERINSSTAKKLVKELLCQDFDPVSYVKEHDLEQICDREILSKIVTEVFTKDTKSVEAYRAGKTAALKAVIGKVMVATGGRANPVILNELICDFAKSL